MSKISISSEVSVKNNKFAFLVKKITNLALKSVVDRLNEGKRGVFYCCELYLNDHNDKDREIREILSKAKELGVRLFIMEISHRQSWGDVLDFDKYRISESELLDILNSAKGKYH